MLEILLYIGAVVKWLIQMRILLKNMKQDQHVLQVRPLSMHGQWMLTKLNYLKVKFLIQIYPKNRKFVLIDVAFKVGGETSIKYLVLQVHYANIDKFKGNLPIKDFLLNKKYIFPAGETDRSGLILTTSSTP
jgi:hypothetical protein